MPASATVQKNDNITFFFQKYLYQIKIRNLEHNDDKMDVNGDNSNSSSNPDNEWKPPTEAEKKVLLARRERSDKISKRMAECLLKGKTISLK